MTLRVRRPRVAELAGVAALVATWLAGAAGARAELVVLRNGEVLKVAAYRLDGERMRLELPIGGRLVLPLDRIERVVDDEIVAADEAAPELAAGTSFRLAFATSDPAPETPFGELFLAAGRQHELNPDLLAAIARAESNFDSGAVSRKGARGLLQLMPATAERFGVPAHELFDPGRNLEAASRYLSFLVEHFDGDLQKILAAYNAGEGTVAKYGGVPPYRETRAYVARVMGYLGL